MKKVIVFMLLLLVTSESFSQQTIPSGTLTKQDYLLKSKKQVKTARILLGGGAALVGTAFIFPEGEHDGTSFFYSLVLFATGSLSMIGSIPFFIASGENKRKATSLSFKMQQVPRLQNTKFINQSLPSINLKISL